MAGQRVLVTGPTGNLGLPVVRALAADAGNEVWALGRFSDPVLHQELADLGVRCVRKDLASDGFDDLPGRFDSVLHAGGLIPPHSERDMTATMQVNTQATARLLERCRSAGTFVLCSTAGVYRHQPRPLVESDEYGFDVAAYGISKIAAEQLVRHLATRWGTPCMVLRIGALYGPRGGTGGAFAPIERMVRGREIWVNPTEPREVSLLWEEDAVELALRALRAGRVPPVTVNFCGDEKVRVEDYCAYAGSLLGIIPRFRFTEATYPTNPLDTTLLHEVLGAARTPWREGVRRMLETLYPERLAAAPN